MNKVFAATSTYGLDETVSAGNLSGAFNVAGVDQHGAGQFLSTKVGQMVGSIISFIGVLLLILVVYAGFLWMTATGNEKKTETAKNILTSAIIGLIIVLSAYAITAFLGRQLTETNALPANSSSTNVNLGN